MPGRDSNEVPPQREADTSQLRQPTLSNTSITRDTNIDVYTKKSIKIITRQLPIFNCQFCLKINYMHYHPTCFGCRPHPSSGIHKTVVTATGTTH